MEVSDVSSFEKGNKELKEKAKELEDTVVTNALALDGTCSGEHGVGIHKIVSSIFFSLAKIRNSCDQNTMKRL